MKKGSVVHCSLLNCCIVALMFSFVFAAPVWGAADLVISSLTVTPPNPTDKDAFDINATVQNIGDAEAVLTGGVCSFQYDQLYIRGSGTIPPGGSLTCSLHNVPPYGYCLGTHTVPVVVDPNNVVSESNENNNSQSITVTVAQSVADFAATSLTFQPTSPTDQDNVTFTGVLKNNGNVATAWYARIYDQSHSSSNPNQGLDIPTLQPGQTYNITFAPFKLSVGSQTVTMHVEQNTLGYSDANPADNDKQVTFAVTHAAVDLTVTSLTVTPPQPLENENMTITATFKNLGNLSVPLVRGQFYVRPGYPQ